VDAGSGTGDGAAKGEPTGSRPCMTGSDGRNVPPARMLEPSVSEAEAAGPVEEVGPAEDEEAGGGGNAAGPARR